MLAIMTLAQVGASVVQQGYGSLAPAIVRFFHINKAQFGFTMTALALGSAMTVAIAGAFVDRFGERKVTIFGGCAICVTLIVAAAVPSYPWLVCWLFVMGLSYAMLTPAGGRAILTWFQRDRGFAMSIRQMGVPVGAVFGGLLMPAIAVRYDYQVALIAGAVCALVLTAGAAAFYHDPEGHEFHTTHLRHALSGMTEIARDPRTIWFTAACTVLSGAQQVMNGFLALTATSRAHTSIGVAALVFVTAQASAIFGRLLWGRLSDLAFNGDRATPVIWICGLCVVAAAGLAAASPGALVLLFAAAVILGVGAAGWNGLFTAAMAEIGGARFAGSALGIGLTSIFFAGAFSPWIFGAFADSYGLPVAWLCLSAMSLVAVVPCIFARKAFREAALRERAAMG